MPSAAVNGKKKIKKSGFTTYRYDNTLTGDYPYETNLDEHYGDWPNP